MSQSCTIQRMLYQDILQLNHQKSDKDIILKSAREKQLFTYKRYSIKQPVDFSAETLQAGKEWDYLIEVMKGNKNVVILPIKNTLTLKMSF